MQKTVFDRKFRKNRFKNPGGCAILNAMGCGGRENAASALLFHVEQWILFPKGRSSRVAKIVAIANQKGGVGKTTTAVNLSSCVAALGKKVLIVDLDPQGNTTTGYGIAKRSVEVGTYDLLIGKAEASQAVRKTEFRTDVIGSNARLAGAGRARVGRALPVRAQTSGFSGMLGGQVIEGFSEGYRGRTLEMITQIHTL